MRARTWLLTSVLAAGILFPAAGPVQSACAEEGDPRAALVVDTGADVLKMCVELDAPQVSGIHLIELAQRQYDLQKTLGYDKKVVCRLANVPEEASNRCLEDSDSFWAYWQGDGDGGWIYSGSGAASTRVEDGDVEGWSYGTGRDGDSHQQPGRDGAVITFESICKSIDDEDPSDKDDGDGSGDEPQPDVSDPPPGNGGGQPRLGPTGPGGSDAGPKSDKQPRLLDDLPAPERLPDERLIDAAPDVSELTTAPEPDEQTTELPPSATTAVNEPEDFPLAGALALVATLAMAGVAMLLVRKRTPIKPKD